METKERKQRAKETKPRKPRNPLYEGLTPREKENAIKRNYYSGKGKIYHARNSRMKRYEIDKQKFEHCSSIEELDNVVFNELQNRGYEPFIIYQLQRKKAPQ